MSKRILSLLVLLAAVVTVARAEAPASSAGSASAATEPVTVGATITAKKAADLDKLAKQPQKQVGRTLRIEGTVTKVCQGAGCWVEVASAKGGKFLAKSLDESVLLPKDIAGRKITVQGVVTMLPAKGAEAHDHAGHAATDHECPAPTYVLSMLGAELPAVKKP